MNKKLLFIVFSLIVFQVAIAEGLIFGSQGRVQPPNIYGEMFFHAHPELEVPIITQNVYENLTSFKMGEFKGMHNETNHSIHIEFPGLYDVDYSLSFSNGVNDEVITAIHVNNEIADNTHTHRKVGTPGDVGVAAGTGRLRLEAGDYLTLMISNNDSSSNAFVAAANLKIKRIDD